MAFGCEYVHCCAVICLQRAGPLVTVSVSLAFVSRVVSLSSYPRLHTRVCHYQYLNLSTFLSLSLLPGPSLIPSFLGSLSSITSPLSPTSPLHRLLLTQCVSDCWHLLKHVFIQVCVLSQTFSGWFCDCGWCKTHIEKSFVLFLPHRWSRSSMRSLASARPRRKHCAAQVRKQQILGSTTKVVIGVGNWTTSRRKIATGRGPWVRKNLHWQLRKTWVLAKRTSVGRRWAHQWQNGASKYLFPNAPDRAFHWGAKRFDFQQIVCSLFHSRWIRKISTIFLKDGSYHSVTHLFVSNKICHWE